MWALPKTWMSLSSLADLQQIIPIGFMNGISPVITNFANAGNNCTTFPDNANALDCPQIE